MNGIIKAQEISERMEFVNTYDEFGATPIFYALDPEHLDILQLLLDYGADPNKVDNMKWTALHFACKKTNRRAIKLLIWHGADKETENVQYRKCHLEVPGRDEERLSMLNYLNSTVELLKVRQCFSICEVSTNRMPVLQIGKFGRAALASMHKELEILLSVTV